MGDSAWFFTTDVWGFDLGTFQARARWYKAPALMFHREWGLWFLFVGPFEFSGHGRRHWRLVPGVADPAYDYYPGTRVVSRRVWP